MLSLYPVSSFEYRLFFLALAKLGDYLSLYGAPGTRRAVMWFPLVSIGIPWVFACTRGRCLRRIWTDSDFFGFHPPDAVTIRQAAAIELSGRELSAS